MATAVKEWGPFAPDKDGWTSGLDALTEEGGCLAMTSLAETGADAPHLTYADWGIGNSDVVRYGRMDVTWSVAEYVDGGPTQDLELVGYVASQYQSYPLVSDARLAVGAPSGSIETTGVPSSLADGLTRDVDGDELRPFFRVSQTDGPPYARFKNLFCYVHVELTYTHPAQTITPETSLIRFGECVILETNNPGDWSIDGPGTITPSADGLSAIYCGPWSVSTITVTVADQDDPENTASAVIQTAIGGGGDDGDDGDGIDTSDIGDEGGCSETLRPEVLERAQIGVQSDCATPVAAAYTLRNVKVSVKPQLPRSPIRVLGHNAASRMRRRREWVEADLAGDSLHFADVAALLASYLCAPSYETPAGAVLTRRLTFTPSIDAADAVRRFTVERGQALGASRFGCAQVSELGLTVSWSKASVKGRMLGAAIEDAFALTSAAYLPRTPIDMRKTAVYYGENVDNLFAMCRPHEVDLALGARFAKLFGLPASAASLSGYKAVPPKLTGSLLLPRTEFAEGLQAMLRSGAGLVFRAEFAGGVIEDGFTHRARWTFPLRLADTSRLPSQDVHSARFDFEAVYDADLNSWLEVVIDTVFPDALGVELAA